MKTVLITGSSGMLGKDIFFVFNSSNKFNVFGLDKIKSEKFPNENQIIEDLTDVSSLMKILTNIKPDIIIHCAAIVNLHVCETNRHLANSLHIESTKLIANFNTKKTKLIYISTDSVFDGKRGNYIETDKTNPLNYYAQSKIFGEDEAKKNPNHLIIRTNIFGYNIPLKESLAEWAIVNFNQENKISGFTDVIFNAIYTKHFAEILYKVIQLDATGTINIASVNNISKYSFLKYLGANYFNKYDLIESSLSKKINFEIKRPMNTTLNVSKLLKITNVPTVEEGIEELVKDYLKE